MLDDKLVEIFAPLRWLCLLFGLSYPRQEYASTAYKIYVIALLVFLVICSVMLRLQMDVTILRTKTAITPTVLENIASIGVNIINTMAITSNVFFKRNVIRAFDLKLREEVKQLNLMSVESVRKRKRAVITELLLTHAIVLCCLVFDWIEFKSIFTNINVTYYYLNSIHLYIVLIMVWCISGRIMALRFLFEDLNALLLQAIEDERGGAHVQIIELEAKEARNAKLTQLPFPEIYIKLCRLLDGINNLFGTEIFMILALTAIYITSIINYWVYTSKHDSFVTHLRIYHMAIIVIGPFLLSKRSNELTVESHYTGCLAYKLILEMPIVADDDTLKENLLELAEQAKNRRVRVLGANFMQVNYLTLLVIFAGVANFTLMIIQLP